MQAQNLPQTLQELSTPRLASYHNFFAPADDAELYRLYCWNENVAGSFRFLINSVEIAMRNAFHRELSLRYGALAGTHSSDWYNELALAGWPVPGLTDTKKSVFIELEVRNGEAKI